DWSSDVCSSDLKLFQLGDPIFSSTYSITRTSPAAHIFQLLEGRRNAPPVLKRGLPRRAPAREPPCSRDTAQRAGRILRRSAPPPIPAHLPSYKTRSPADRGIAVGPLCKRCSIFL